VAAPKGAAFFIDTDFILDQNCINGGVMRKNAILIVFLLVLFSLNANAQVTGIGVDLRFDLESNMVNDTDMPTRTSNHFIEVPIMFAPNDRAVFEPFLGISFDQVRDADLADPVSSRQLGFSAGAGYYWDLIAGGIIDVSAGPMGRVLFFLQDKSASFTTYVDISLQASMMLNLDMDLTENWMLRFGVDFANLTFDYLDENGTKDWTLFADSQLLKGSAIVSIRYMF
jgi:hypothetical protein